MAIPRPKSRAADSRSALDELAGLGRIGSGWRPGLSRPAQADDAKAIGPSAASHFTGGQNHTSRPAH